MGSLRRSVGMGLALLLCTIDQACCESFLTRAYSLVFSAFGTKGTGPIMQQASVPQSSHDVLPKGTATQIPPTGSASPSPSSSADDATLNGPTGNNETRGVPRGEASALMLVVSGEGDLTTIDEQSDGGWPQLTISITAPVKEMRLFGTEVPIQVLVESVQDLSQWMDRCSVVLTDSSQPDSASVYLTLPLADVMPPNRWKVHARAPLFYEGKPKCATVSNTGDDKLCYMPTTVPGRRSIFARVECDRQSTINTTTTSVEKGAAAATAAAAAAAAAAATDSRIVLASHEMAYYATHLNPDLSDAALSLLTFTKRVRVQEDVQHTQQQHVGMRVKWDEPAEAQAEVFCMEQSGEGRAADACVGMVTGAVEAMKDERYHAYVSSLMVHLSEQGTDLSTLEGSSYSCPEKLPLMKRLVTRPGVRHVCEVGFNAGHSALFWLMYGHTDTTVLAFDLGVHEYTPKAVNWVLERMGPRMEVIMGDSRCSIPAYIEMNPGVQCDIILIDGGHADGIPYVDAENLRRLANKESHVVLFDDSNWEDVNGAIERLKANGYFVEDEILHTRSKAVSFEVTRKTRGWLIFWNYDTVSDTVIGRFEWPEAQQQHASS